MFDPAWLAAVRARCDVAPLSVRGPLRLSGHEASIGSIEPGLGERMISAGLPLSRQADGWRVDGDRGEVFDATLERLACWLAAQGLLSTWRDELLDVADVNGRVLARIERAAVRRLGIATRAVHLVGRSENGGVWVQQRALDKAVDPGLWDTLMGGTVGAGEDIAATLARETWEEAGLRIAELQGLRDHGRFTVRRPVPDGWMIEHTHVFEALVPKALVPVNQDGEVERFECLPPAELQRRLVAGEFTLEATRILADALQRPR